MTELLESMLWVPPVQADLAENNPRELSFVRNKDKFIEGLVISGGVDLTDYAKKQWVIDYVAGELLGLSVDLTGYATETWVYSQGFLTTQVQSNWAETSTTSPAYILNKPIIPDTSNFVTKLTLDSSTASKQFAISGDTGSWVEVTTSGSPVQSNWIETNTASLAYIQNKPVIPAAQIQSDWTQVSNVALDYIKNKPDLSDMATKTWVTQKIIDEVSGGTIDLTGYATETWVNNQGFLTTQVQSNWTEATTTSPAYILNKPIIPDTSNFVTKLTLDSSTASKQFAISGDTGSWVEITTSGSPVQSNWTETNTASLAYIQNKPVIPAAQIQSDWTQVSNVALDYIKNKPDLSDMATKTWVTQKIIDEVSGGTIDLTGYATETWVNNQGFLTSQVQSNWTEATTTSPAYIQNKPSIPPSPVQSNWTESNTSSLAYILNKPTIPPTPVQSDWNQTGSTELDFIRNKPIIPSIAGLATETWVTANFQSIAPTGGANLNETLGVKNGSWVILEYATEPWVLEKILDIVTEGTIDLTGYATETWVNNQGFLTSQVQSNWTESITTSPAYIQNKPAIPTVNNSTITFQRNSAGFTGNTFTVNAASATTINFPAPDWTAASGTVGYINNKPSIPAAQIQSNWTETSTSSLAYIQNKPAIPPAFTGTLITSTTGQSVIGTATTLNAAITLHEVARTGSWNNLLDRPSIPSAPGTGVLTITQNGVANATTFNANATANATIALVAPNWSAASGTAGYIDNKPSIPTVNNPTITFQRNGQTFANNTLTLNQSGAATINFPAPDWNAASGTVGYIANKPAVGGIPNDGTLSINQNGVVNTATFSANQSTNVTIYLETPDWNAVSTSAGYILNKPNIPTVNNSTITFQRNGQAFTGNTFTVNAASATTINFPAPDWTAASGTVGYINNKPSIPTVNNSTITFQRNGQVFSNNTFTLNQSGAGTINLPAPDWNAASGTVGYIANKPTLTDFLDGSKLKYTIITINAGQWVSGNYTHSINNMDITKEPVLSLPIPTSRLNADAVCEAQIIATAFTASQLTLNAKNVPTGTVILSFQYWSTV